jgi:hypothetical protein
MIIRTFAAAAMAMTVISTAALAAANAPSPTPMPAHRYDDLDKIGVIRGTTDRCAILDDRFDEYLVSRQAHRDPGVKDAIALRDEGDRLCRLGNEKTGALYLHKAISALIGRPAA